MHPATTNRDHVLAVMGTALQALKSDPTTDPATYAELSEAVRWLVSDEQQLYREGAVDDMAPGDRYLSQNDVVSLVQSAIEAHSDAVEVASDEMSTLTESSVDIIGFIKSALAKLRASKAPFTWPTQPTDFRFPLANACRVVLVSDWGTGFDGAIKVAEQIRALAPDHVIHLGDIYPSGTRDEAQKFFVSLWKDHGPPNARYWALNGNHEMISKGEGYIYDVLPFCGQPASCFTLENEHWRFIALDSAYKEYDLEKRQHDWLHAQLANGTAKNILLTHHQIFSAVDKRPAKGHLCDTARQFLDTNRIHAWFWGHEHACMAYETSPDYWNVKFRCIGHGGKDTGHPYYDEEKAKYPAPKVAWSFETQRAGDDAPIRNGFVVIDIEGASLILRYIDEEGEEGGTGESWQQ